MIFWCLSLSLIRSAESAKKVALIPVESHLYLDEDLKLFKSPGFIRSHPFFRITNIIHAFILHRWNFQRPKHAKGKDYPHEYHKEKWSSVWEYFPGSS
jgi:hypothetical protein